MVPEVVRLCETSHGLVHRNPANKIEIEGRCLENEEFEKLRGSEECVDWELISIRMGKHDNDIFNLVKNNWCGIS